jgi:hypothetical protein
VVLQLPFYALLVAWWVIHFSFAALVAVFVAGIVLMGVIERKVKQAYAAATARAAADLAAAEDPLRAVRQACRQHGAGPYLGVGDRGRLRFARPQRAVLLLGPKVGEDDRGDHPDRPRERGRGGVHVDQARPRDGDRARAITDREGVVVQSDGRPCAGGTRGVALVTGQLLEGVGWGAADGQGDERPGWRRDDERVALGDAGAGAAGAVSARGGDRWARGRVRR